MYEGFWEMLIWSFITMVMIVPFGIAGIYFYVSLRQLCTGIKEKAAYKIMGGIVAFLLSTLVLGSIVAGWIWMWLL